MTQIGNPLKTKITREELKKAFEKQRKENSKKIERLLKARKPFIPPTNSGILRDSFGRIVYI